MNTSLTISTSSSSSSSSSSPHSSGSTSPPSSYQTSHTTLFISPTSVTSDTDTDADGDANLNSNSNSNLNSNASAIPPLTSPPTIPSPPTPNLPSHFTLPSLTIPFFPFNPQQWWESKASSSSSSSSSPLLPTTLKDTEDVDEYVNEHVPFLKEEIPERSLRTLQKSVPFLFHLQHGGWVLGYLLMEGITGMIALRGWWRVFQVRGV
ncbi:hypothetical protein HMI55_000828 [Coelomomyces lativittatus]|nr:hypothetical protein HMI55_000828 [Coelomomyces lativittatus]